MKKSNLTGNLVIIVPPLLLVITGIAVYIAVIKILTPDLKTISATPNPTQSSASATQSPPEASSTAKTSNPIATQVTLPSDSDLNQWQADADSGKDVWRLDPISAAEHQAGVYGFIPGDQLTLVTHDLQSETPSQTTTISASHYNVEYQLTMIQPKKTGAGGIWIIQSIEKQP